VAEGQCVQRAQLFAERGGEALRRLVTAAEPLVALHGGPVGVGLLDVLRRIGTTFCRVQRTQRARLLKRSGLARSAFDSSGYASSPAKSCLRSERGLSIQVELHRTETVKLGRVQPFEMDRSRARSACGACFSAPPPPICLFDAITEISFPRGPWL